MNHEILGPNKLKVNGKNLDKKHNRKTKKDTKDFLNKIGEFKEIYWDENYGRAIIETNKIKKFLDKKEEVFENTGWKINTREPTKSGMVEKTRKLIFEGNGRYSFLKEVGRKIRKKTKDKNWIRISFLGGCREVGRNAFLIQTNNSKILLDYGVSMNSHEPPISAPELNLSELDCVILSHSHLDHSGKIASLYSKGFKGPLYTTELNLSLLRLLKKDAYKISKSKEKDIGYTPSDIDNVLKHSIPIDYKEKIKISPDIKATFLDAGHLPGSSGILLEIENEKNLFYTGDFNTRNSKLLYPADFDLPKLDALIMESTYAYEEIPSKKRVEKKLVNIVEETIENGGTPIISTFAIGRAQEVISILEEFDVNSSIYLDGMIREATKIISSYPSYLKNKITWDLEFIYGDDDREEAIVKNDSIVLTTSGMLTGGAVEFYLSRLEKDENSSLILPGYLAEETPGREVWNGNKCIEINGNTYNLELNTYVLRFSGHSDHSDLWKFLHEVEGKPKTFVVHGEEKKASKLAKSINSKLGWESHCPKNLDAFRID